MILDVIKVFTLSLIVVVGIVGTVLTFQDIYDTFSFSIRRRRQRRATLKRVRQLSKMKKREDRDAVFNAYCDHAARNSGYKYSNPFDDFSWELNMIAQNNPYLTVEELQKYAQLNGTDEYKRHHVGALNRVIHDEKTPEEVLISLVVSSSLMRTGWYRDLIESPRVPEEYKAFAALNKPAPSRFWDYSTPRF